MRTTLLWLLACFTSVAHADPLRVMSAPSLLRAGTVENIFVECQDCGHHPPMTVTISVWNHPTKTRELVSTNVYLNRDNKFQKFGKLVIPSDGFDKDPTVKQFVYLRADFPGFRMEKVVLVSFHSGYLFIQTDKGLYTPGSPVKYRVFALTPGLTPGSNGTVCQMEAVTPEGIVIPLTSFSTSGIHSGTYKLAESANVGQWMLVSRFHSSPQLSYSAKFEVKKYVLPSYEVKLTPDSPFYSYNIESFNVIVTAKYLFGEEVQGWAHVVFGIVKDSLRTVLTASLQRIEISDGNGVATLQKDHILKTFQNISELAGGSLFVIATVYTESGSEMVEAELRNIKITHEPYSISFAKTPKYFKAGHVFTVRVTVSNPDGTPAKGIQLEVKRKHRAKGSLSFQVLETILVTTGDNGRATVSISTRESDDHLLVTAEIIDASKPAYRHSYKSHAASPHQSTSPNFIHIDGILTNVKLGSILNVKIGLNPQSTLKDITYLILSRGQLITFGRQPTEKQNSVAVVFPVTKEMSPSFRLIAYYHTSPTEVVSDSVWVEVDDSCMDTLKLEPHDKRIPLYAPRNTFKLKITGEPGADVALGVADKGVYVLNQNYLLTQKKVWETLEKADSGCTPGGGRSSMEVFFDAGLMFQTDFAGGTSYRQEVDCPSSSSSARKKRSVSVVKTMTLASRYRDPLERECCLDGMRTTLLSYTCAQRALYITDGKPCEAAFLFCCEEHSKLRSELKENNLLLARSQEQVWNDINTDKIVSRTKFEDSWGWEVKTIPSKGELIVENPLKDSITTWMFTGISLSQNNGICVGKSLEVIVFKAFFIDLRLPYSAVVGEQIEIRAILHNYLANRINVYIELKEHENVCSSASKRGKYAQQVKVDGSSTRAVSFVIIPMKSGKIQIEVRGLVRDNGQSDGVIKTLLVVPNGELKKVQKELKLNPRGSSQVETISHIIQRSAMVPNTPSKTTVLLTGREGLSFLVENVIGASSMGSMIYQPTGCGEQNMKHMTTTVIATTYLDKTNKWTEVGLDRRDEALKHIRTGLANVMNYANYDGSFSFFSNNRHSTWLTAHVVRVFSMASHLINIESNVICKTVKFLINTKQLSSGMFKETGTTIHREYSPHALGRNASVSLTAFCLIALQKSNITCQPHVNNLLAAMTKSVAYLERHLPTLTNPYAVAITSYALANAKKFNKEILYSFATPERTHWESPLGHSYSLQATAYALLALVKAGFLEDARPIVSWLTSQQKAGGGYGSTQTTMIVYQALSEYWIVAKAQDYHLEVELKVPGKSTPYSYLINRGNYYTTRTTKKFDINENVTVTARGTGEATLMLVSEYYALPQKSKSVCSKFNLSVEFTQDEENYDIYKLTIKFRFNDTEDASMSIVDITMPTGFIHTDTVDKLAQGRARVIQHWEYNKTLSETSSVIFYLNKVAHDRTEELTFHIKQTHEVSFLQPASVSIYEYYDADGTKCVQYYHPQKSDGRIVRRCNGEECLCAEENCSLQRTGQIDARERNITACKSSKIDFVYRVILEAIHYHMSFDTYTMKIKAVIKGGSKEIPKVDQVRKFVSSSHCRESLKLQQDKAYLIMGASEDVLPDASTEFEYLLGERTWIEYWPSEGECKMDEHKDTCAGMKALVEKFNTVGCEL